MKCGHFYLFTTTGFNISSHQTLCSIYALFHEASCFPISGLKRYKMVSQDTRNRSVSNQVLRASGIDAELDRYFAEELSLSSCQENELSFWINREQSYSLLAPLGRGSGICASIPGLCWACIFCLWRLVCSKAKSCWYKSWTSSFS